VQGKTLTSSYYPQFHSLAAIRAQNMFEDVYLWIKALHVIAVIAWMAGMLYLPRLFVYHCEAEIGSKQSETFKVMERRLLKAIINPAMIVTWLFGLYLAWSGHWFTFGWLHVKLALVLAMSGEGLCRRPATAEPEILSDYQ
jgi:putative membrane protein